MADKATPPSNQFTNPSPHPSTASNTGFIPRSSSFPDNIDSDDEDTFDPTPVHSPSGPQYDDLPPSYDEAQQQALHDARTGVPSLNPNHLDVNRITLDDASSQYEIPANAEVHAHRATADELAREGSRSVLVQHVRNSDNVPVGRVGTTPSAINPTATSSNQASQLLNAALQFTQHEPDADARYAPKLTRPVAIPQDISHARRKGKARARRGERRGARRGRGDACIPGAWPGASTDTLPSPGDKDEEELAQFLRAYAKSLHAHSIRPAEFLDFLDGLNALCAATGCTPADLIHTSAESSSRDIGIVRSYIDATNEVFFVPRGLRVSLQSFASLLDAANIPEERGQRAGAVASILDPRRTPAKRAQALHPWIETLELNVSEPSISAVMLREMGERFKNAPPSPSTNTAHESTQAPENEKSRLEREYAKRDHSAADDDDPPHSIPGEYPQSSESSRPAFGDWRGRGFAGRGGPWTPFGPGRGPFGPAGYGPHGPPGFTPFVPPCHSSHGPLGFGPHRHPGFGPQGPWSFQPTGGPNPNNNGWGALGQSIGKWGEEFGKRMESWGEQFAKEAAEWGNDLSKRAGELGQRAGGSYSGCGTGAVGPSTQPGASVSSSSVPPAANSRAAVGQETGIHRERSTSHDHVAAEFEKHASKRTARKHDDDDDDDMSSVSSDSSSDSESDSDFDVDDEDYANEYSKASSAFSERMREINATADASRAKGKKSPSDIERERALAIEKAAKEKTALEEKIERKRTKRAIMREFRSQRRDLKRGHRQARRELRSQGRGKKSKEWKEIKKNYREKKKALRTEKNDVRRQFKEARKVERSERRGKLEHDAGDSVWVVVENL